MDYVCSRPFASLALCFALAVGSSALAQDEPPAPPPAPAAAPSPPPSDAPSAPPQAEPEAASTPPPSEELPPAPPPAEEPAPARRFEGQVGGGGYAEETYPEDDPTGHEDRDRDAGGGFKMPGFSIRLDPFNWLLDGRLGFELEVAALDWLSIELVPVFVANSEPPTIDFDSLDEDVSQHSNGLGDLAGTSLGVGFWLEGKAFSGYVLRAIFTNYGYAFKASDSVGTFDRVDRTERRLMGFFGSYMRWGFFTIGGGLGLGFELNQQERCGLDRTPGSPRVTADSDADCDGQLQLSADRNASAVYDVNGFLHPVYIDARFSLGVIID